MSAIERGSRVQVRTADGRDLGKRALAQPEMGHDFEVVWVCSEDEWEAARREEREPEGMPWPAEDVELVEAVAS